MATLCQVCKRIKLRPRDSKVAIEHHVNGDSLEQAAEAGCVLCQALRLTAGGEIPMAKTQLYLEVDADGVGLLIREKHKLPADPRVMIYSDRNVDGLPGRHVPARASDPACMDALSGWMKACLHEHQECPAPRDSPLPTRVIDVGPADGSAQPHVMITHGMAGQWIALSHRWGLSQFLTTTSINLDAHCRGIEWDHLPKTFQDAITLTRRLEFRYLWIDCLCILQDSKEDWKIESMKMRDVYKNCTLNIAAAHPQSPSSGILADRKPVIDEDNPYTVPSMDGIKLPYITLTGETIQVRIQKYPQHVASHRESDSNCLMTRGWVLQEFTLSPRTVSWTEEQMTWECVEHWAEEYDRRIFKSPMYNGRQPFLNKQLIRISTPGIAKREIYEAWMTILLSYVKRDLTYETDSLAAISGVAQEVQSKTGDRYIAGLWLGDFNNGLLWFLHRLPRKVAVSSAPSWSWVSQRRTGEIINPGFRLASQELQVIKIGNTEVQTYGQNHSLDITDAPHGITINAPVKPSPIGVNGGRLSKGTLSAWSDNCWLVDENKGKVCYLTYKFDKLDCLADPGNLGSFEFADPVLCVGVATTTKSSMAGLLVRETKAHPGAYTRVGFFEVDLKWEAQVGEWERREMVLR